MSWADFYLFCFAFGFLFSLVSVLSGHLHLHSGHDGTGQHGFTDHGAHGHGHGNHGHAADHGHDSGAHTDNGGRPEISPFNMGTASAFLAWFGGSGYLATKFTQLWVAGTLLMSLAAGLVGGYVVYLFLSKVLMREREELNPADYDMIGVLAKVSGPIRPQGTGEILFSRAGTRNAAPARSEDCIHIPNGTEVVVTRFENGIAYVRRWEDFIGSA